MLRRLLCAFALVFAFLQTPVIGFHAIAGAQDITDNATAVAPVASLTLSAFTVLVLSSFLIPVVNGLLVRSGASTVVKQIVAAFLSTIAGLLTTYTQLDGTAMLSLATLQYAMLSWLVAAAGYLAVFKPLGTNDQLLPNRGLHFGTDSGG